MSLAILFLTFLGGLAMGVPVAVTLALSSIAYLVTTGIPLTVVPQKIFAGIDVFVLLCIPGFILAGNLMNAGGITERIVRFAQALVGWLRGGLGLTNVAASMLFGGVSGTAVADAASIGGMMIPGMKRVGYPPAFAAAVTSASSTMGPIIPPSVPMIIIGSLSGLSVGKMFIAGALPGVLLGVGMLITTYVIAMRRGFPRDAWQGWAELGRSFAAASWALIMTAMIVGGMLMGFVTPTETAVIASLYAMVVGVVIYGDLKITAIPRLMVDSAVSAAGILFLVGAANVFGWILVSEHIPQTIADAVLGLTDNKYLVILLVNLVLIFVGMFMETIAALIILFVPLLTLAQAVGIDPIHSVSYTHLTLPTNREV